MNEQEWKDWQNIVDSARECTESQPCDPDRAIRAADRIVQSAREYVRAERVVAALDPRNPDCAPEVFAKIATHMHLLAAVGEVTVAT